MDKLIIISFTVGLIIVGGLAVFSIYLHLDESTISVEESTITIKEIILPEQNCLEKWDYLYIANQKTNDHQLIEYSRELNLDFFVTSGCFESFREWMPINHSGWDGYVVFVNEFESRCENYINGNSYPEWFEPVLDELCKDVPN